MNTNSTLDSVFAAAKFLVPVARGEAVVHPYNICVLEDIKSVLADLVSLLLFFTKGASA